MPVNDQYLSGSGILNRSSLPFAVERLGIKDLAQLVQLEELCFAYHWSEEQFRLGLEKGAYHVLGIRGKSTLKAYLAFSKVEDEMEIMNIAVHPDLRRRGLGTLLLETGLRVGARLGAVKCFLDVKKTNVAAITLYTNHGFNKIGVRKKYYPDTGEDALLFRLDFDQDTLS